MGWEEGEERSPPATKVGVGDSLRAQSQPARTRPGPSLSPHPAQSKTLRFTPSGMLRLLNNLASRSHELQRDSRKVGS